MASEVLATRTNCKSLRLYSLSNPLLVHSYSLKKNPLLVHSSCSFATLQNRQERKVPPGNQNPSGAASCDGQLLWSSSGTQRRAAARGGMEYDGGAAGRGGVSGGPGSMGESKLRYLLLALEL